MMNIQSDIVVYDSIGNLVIVVEVKNKLGTDSDWATKMRRNMMIHGALPDVPYFLLALPDRFYLWKDTLSTQFAQPDYEIDPEPLFKPYSNGMEASLQNLSGAGFELLLISWLGEMVRGTELADGTRDRLIESGLLEAIKHGNLVSKVVQ